MSSSNNNGNSTTYFIPTNMLELLKHTAKMLKSNSDSNTTNEDTNANTSISVTNASNSSFKAKDNKLPINGSIIPKEDLKASEDRYDATPIKSEQDISNIIQYYLAQNNYRDLMLFVLGINFGLRISDLVSLRFRDLLTEEQEFKTSFSIVEKKTKNTKGNKKIVFSQNKMSNLTKEEQINLILNRIDDEIDNSKPNKPQTKRTIYINEVVREMIAIYLNHINQTGKRNINGNNINGNKGICLDDYLFVAENSNNKKFEYVTYTDSNGKLITTDKVIQSHLSESATRDILRNATNYLNIQGRFSTHSLRKTFAWHILNNEDNSTKVNQRKIDLLQSIFNHSSSSITLRYAGLTEETMAKAYNHLSLGIKDIAIECFRSSPLNNN